MKIIFQKTALTLAVSTAVLLTACGGGGSDTTSTGTSVINANNVADVATQVYVAMVNMNIYVRSTQYFGPFLEGKATAPVTGFSAPFSCTVNGGTYTYTIAASGTVSNGDSLVQSNNNCTYGSGTDTEVINGTQSVVFSNMSGVPASGANAVWSGTLTTTFTNYSEAENKVANLLNGNVSLNFNQVADGTQQYTGTAANFTHQLTYAKSTIAATYDSYKYVASITPASLEAFHNDMTVRLSSTQLSSALYTVTTLSDLMQQDNSSNNPTAGKLKITATDNSSVTLTIVDSTKVQLDLDTNGDGVIDSTSTMLWTDLQNRLLPVS